MRDCRVILVRKIVLILLFIDINLFSSTSYNVDFSTYEFKEGLVFSSSQLKIKNEFKEIFSSTYPSGRRKFGLTEISQNRVLLFGGTIDSTTYASSNETWLFNSDKNKWELIDTSTHPSKRAGISLCYDINTGKVLLFGGVEEDYFNDTWIFDVNTLEWQEIFPSTYPSSRHGYGLAISSNSKAILFGGIKKGGVFLNDTWEFDFLSLSWKLLNPSVKPSQRAYMGMAGDGKGKILMYGGEDNVSYKSDTWIFENSNWQAKSPSSPPSKRTGVALCYNEKGNSFVMFSGFKDELAYTGVTNEVWIFTSDCQWHNATSLFTNLPDKRVYSKLVYQKDKEIGFLFGGEGDGGVYLNDSWKHIFYSSGTFISKLLDTGDSLYPVDYFKIFFTGNFPVNTETKFQISTSTDNINFSSFRGPDGNATSYYEINGEDIYLDEDGRRFLKIKIFMNYKIFTEDSFYIDSVSISYNHKPEFPKLYDKYFGKGETTSELTPNFTWYNSNDPDGELHTYNLEVSTEANFVNPMVITGIEEDKSLGYSYSWTTPTLTEGYYFFRVKCFDDLSESPYSEIWDFYIDTTPPAQVTDLVAITGDAPGEIKLYWTSTGDDGTLGAITNGKIHVKYKEKENFLNWYSSNLSEVYISTDTFPGEKQFFVLTGLKDNTSYFIAVAMEDEAVEENKNLGLGSGATVITAFSFTDRYPVVDFIKPLSNNTVSGNFLTEWRSSDPDGDKIFFNIYLYNETSENLIVSSLNTTYYYINSYPFKDGSWQVKIKATDDRGLSKDYYSDSFFIDNPNFAPKINIISPLENSIIEGEISINWVYSDTNSWQNHEFKVFYSTDNLNYNLIETLNRNTTFYLWDTYLLPNGTYFLKVKITDEGSLSGEDVVENIVLNNSNLAPEEFSLVSPSNDEYIFTLLPSFSWEESVDTDGDLVSYSLYISSADNFNYFYEVKNIDKNFYTLDFSLKNYTSYYWKVKASDSRGLSRWSEETYHFHINIGSFSILSTSPSDLSYILYSSVTYIEVNFNKPPFNFYSGYVKIYENDEERTDFSISQIQNIIRLNMDYFPSREYKIFFSSFIIDSEGNNLTGKRDYVFYTLMSKNEDNNLIYYGGEIRIFVPKNSIERNAVIKIDKVYFANDTVLLNSKNLSESSNAGKFLYPYCYRISLIDDEGKEIKNTVLPLEVYFRINDSDKNNFWDGTLYPLKQIEVRKFMDNNWIGLNTEIGDTEMKVDVEEFSYFSLFAKAKYYKASSVMDGINVFPNPFKDEVYIWYKLNGNFDVDLKIYSLSGELVKDKKISSLESPPFIWDGRNNKGEDVADGTYILILKVGGERIKEIIGRIR